MSRVRTPDGIEIASLKQKREEHFDPMAAGAGTPWEDRGSHGTVGAFFKTCKMSMTSPGVLMRLIRRPETTSDATAFLIGCGILWGVSALEHGLIRLAYIQRTYHSYDIDTTWYMIYCGLGVAAAIAGTFFLFRLYNIVYGKLIAQEKSQGPLPAPLLYNVTAYALGPSLLAIIPVAGPPLALLWIFMNLIAVGAKRLRLRTSAAVVDALLAFLVVLATGFAAYFIGSFAISYVVGDAVTPPPPPAKRVILR